MAFSTPGAQTVLAHRVPQVCTSFACGAAGAAQLWKWRRGDATVREGAWRLYGWYCGLACAGCVAGGVGWIGFFLFHKIVIDSNHDLYIAVETMRVATNNSLAWHDVLSLEQQYEASYLSFSVANQWYAVFFAFYPVEVLCVSIAKLMTVDRLAVFQRVFDATMHAKDAMHATQRKRIFRLQLSVTATVVLLNVVCIVAYWVASGYSVRNAEVQHSAFEASVAYFATLQPPADSARFTVEHAMSKYFPSFPTTTLANSRNVDVHNIHYAVEVQSFAEIGNSTPSPNPPLPHPPHSHVQHHSRIVRHRRRTEHNANSSRHRVEPREHEECRKEVIDKATSFTWHDSRALGCLPHPQPHQFHRDYRVHLLCPAHAHVTRCRLLI